VLILYVAGALLLPALHRCFSVCVCADTMRGLAQHCCPGAHAHDTHTQDATDADEQEDSQPDAPSHDPSTCASCQLASIAIHTASVAVTLPQSGPVATALPDFFQQPDVQIPRCHPFSCGPPAWLHSPGMRAKPANQFNLTQRHKGHKGVFMVFS